jgi:hypothetical protein
VILLAAVPGAATEPMQDPLAKRVAAVGVAGIVVMGVAGVLHAEGAAPDAFDLNGEYTVPAFFSAGLLALAAGMALALSTAEAGIERALLIALAAAFAFLAMDELFSIHESIDVRSDVYWQVLYLPAVIVFVGAIWRVTGSLGRRTPESLMIFAGLGAWAVAQMIEAAIYSEVTPSLIGAHSTSWREVHDFTHSLPYYALAIPEEMLEMGGSLLLAVALAAVVSRGAARSH